MLDQLLESPSRCGWTQIDLSALHRQAFPADAAWTVWTHQLSQSDVNFHFNRAQPMTVSLQWGESALLFKCSIWSSCHPHFCTPEMLSGSKQNLRKSQINFKENWSKLETNEIIFKNFHAQCFKIYVVLENIDCFFSHKETLQNTAVWGEKKLTLETLVLPQKSAARMNTWDSWSFIYLVWSANIVRTPKSEHILTSH